MVLIKTKQFKRLEIEKVVKSGWSGRFEKGTNFPKNKKEMKDFGEIDGTDHQLEEKEMRESKEMRDSKEMRELEKLNLLKKKK